MRKLFYSLSLLIVFSTSAFATEPDTPNYLSLCDVSPDSILLKFANSVPNYDFIVELEEKDAPFDFNIKDYLPENFNAYEGLFEEYSSIEEDEAFDFNTKDYLPVGFNANLDLDKIVEVSIIEDDEPFDFDTTKYLPSNFNAFIGLYEDYGTVEEEDEAFDFDTQKYLPNNFDAHAGLKKERSISTCRTLHSI